LIAERGHSIDGALNDSSLIDLSDQVIDGLQTIVLPIRVLPA